MAERVVIKEVSARDGLQAQPKHLTVEQRMALDLLMDPEIQLVTMIGKTGSAKTDAALYDAMALRIRQVSTKSEIGYKNQHK